MPVILRKMLLKSGYAIRSVVRAGEAGEALTVRVQKERSKESLDTVKVEE